MTPLVFDYSWSKGDMWASAVGYVQQAADFCESAAKFANQLS